MGSIQNPRQKEENIYAEDDEPLAKVPRADPSLEAFQTKLDEALSSLFKWKVPMLIAGYLDYMAFKGPLPHKPLHDSKKLKYVKPAILMKYFDC